MGTMILCYLQVIWKILHFLEFPKVSLYVKCKGFLLFTAIRQSFVSNCSSSSNSSYMEQATRQADCSTVVSKTSLSDLLSVEFTESETDPYPALLPDVSTSNTFHYT